MLGAGIGENVGRRLARRMRVDHQALLAAVAADLAMGDENVTDYQRDRA